METSDNPGRDTPADHVAHLELHPFPRQSPTPPGPGQNDLFHARVPDDFVRRVFDVMADTPRHTYQLLTKRPKRLARLAGTLPWPENVWMGVSVEDAAQGWRADRLREVPAAVRFISAEPLLGPLDDLDLDGIDWLIAGGESGPNHRPVDSAWIDGLRNACGDAGVAFFFKLLCTDSAGTNCPDDRPKWSVIPQKSTKAANVGVELVDVHVFVLAVGGPSATGPASCDRRRGHKGPGRRRTGSVDRRAVGA